MLACAPLTSARNPEAPQKASAAAMCLIPLYQQASDAAAAAEPAVESVRKKLADGAPITVVDLAPLVELAELVLDVRACVLQVRAAAPE